LKRGDRDLLRFFLKSGVPQSGVATVEALPNDRIDPLLFASAYSSDSAYATAENYEALWAQNPLDIR
jgi:hypothetical protein